MTEEINKELKELIEVFLNESINETQQSQLDQLLQKDIEARKLFLEMSGLDYHLHEHFSAAEKSKPLDIPIELQQLPPPEDFSSRFLSMRRQLNLLRGMSAAVILGLTGALWYQFNQVPPAAIETVIKAPAIEKPVLANLHHADKALWKNFSGQTFSAGRYELLQGQAQLIFKNGTELQLRAPAILQIDSAMSCRLHKGEIAAYVPEAAHGFSIDLPGGNLVDLGTEFSVRVNDDGSSDLKVHEGEVTMSLLNKNGSTLRDASVTTGQGVNLQPTQLKLVAAEAKLEGFLRPQFQSSPADATYNAAITQSQPDMYWDFNTQTVNGFVRDNHGNYSAKLSPKARVEDGCLNLHESGLFIHQLKQFNNNHYSIECWARPQRRQRMSLLSIIDTERKNGQHKHLAYLEMMGKVSDLRHPAYALRFLHRYPMGKSFGTNSFSRESFASGEWVHIVAVRDDSGLKLYINGNLSSTAPMDQDKELITSEFKLVLGQLDPHRPERRFYGEIDELALYSRSLSAEEIKQHFLSVKP